MSGRQANRWFVGAVSTALLLLFLCAHAAAELPSYQAYLAQPGWQDAPDGAQIVLSASNEVQELIEGQTLTWSAQVETAGYYWLAMDYQVSGEGLVTPEGELLVDGQIAHAKLRRLSFPALWEDQEMGLLLDRYGHQRPPLQQQKSGWIATALRDSGRLEPQPLRIYLDSGEHRLSLRLHIGGLEIQNARLIAPSHTLSYAEYASAHKKASQAENTLIVLQAEQPAYKNTTMVVPGHDPGVDAVPYHTHQRLLNSIEEATWILAGDALYYRFEVEQTGLYHLAFKYKQTDKPNVRVFRTITLDNQLPFLEAQAHGFDYAERWRIQPLSDAAGQQMALYLTAGEHTLGIQVEAAPYRDVIRALQGIQAEVSQLYIELKKVVGGQADHLRDWTLADYFPDMVDRLQDIRGRLLQESEALIALNGGQRTSDQQMFITLAVKSLDALLKKPNEIPKKAGQFTEGSGSIAQLIAKGISDINMQAMTLDELYIHSPDQAPQYTEQGLGVALVEGLSRFARTFTEEEAQFNKDAVALEVWVQRGRAQIELMQRLADSWFTPQTGIVVNFRQLMDDHKLTLAVMAEQAPDAAMNIGAGLPFEYGLRGIAQDLRTFANFPSVMRQFPPGVFLGLIAGEGVYGLPETIDFQVTFYRKDILDSLSLPVPDTWEEVARIMPELQRYGMSYYTPLATGAGSKGLSATAPHILQSGGRLFSEDGLRTAMDSEQAISGIQRMCDLSTVYGLSLEVNSFFESFRNGTTPIGIAGFPTYLEMRIAAPELMNNWGIAPAPGVMGPDGTIHRQYTGLSTTNLVFAQSKHREEAWQLLNWWAQAEVQAEYARQLALLMGPEFLFNTANTQAFATLSIPAADKAIILAQRAQMEEIQLLPGWYMVQRELSNVWNAVVFDDAKLRNMLDQAVVLSNREISRRMEEFGYVINGQPVKPYPVYSLADMMAWQEGGP